MYKCISVYLVWFGSLKLSDKFSGVKVSKWKSLTYVYILKTQWLFNRGTTNTVITPWSFGHFGCSKSALEMITQKTTTPGVPQRHNNKRGRQQLGDETDTLRKEKPGVRHSGESSLHIDGGFLRRRGDRVTDRNPLEHGQEPGSGAHRQKAG